MVTVVVMVAIIVAATVVVSVHFVEGMAESVTGFVDVAEGAILKAAITKLAESSRNIIKGFIEKTQSGAHGTVWITSSGRRRREVRIPTLFDGSHLDFANSLIDLVDGVVALADEGGAIVGQQQGAGLTEVGEGVQIVRVLSLCRSRQSQKTEGHQPKNGGGEGF